MQRTDDYTNTHLEHLKDLEEARMWEEGAITDCYAVSTPVSHIKSFSESLQETSE